MAMSSAHKEWQDSDSRAWGGGDAAYCGDLGGLSRGSESPPGLEEPQGLRRRAAGQRGPWGSGWPQSPAGHAGLTALGALRTPVRCERRVTPLAGLLETHTGHCQPPQVQGREVSGMEVRCFVSSVHYHRPCHRPAGRLLSALSSALSGHPTAAGVPLVLPAPSPPAGP